MDKKLLEWRSQGRLVSNGPDAIQIFVKDIGDQDVNPSNTLLLLHGFPESSFSFHLVLEGLKTRFDRIILFDMIGYGWSDKPTRGYDYSLLTQADLAEYVWTKLGITGGHVLAHDMGNSVLTELIYRSQNEKSDYLNEDFFLSATFTNGSIVLDMAELRFMQKLLLSKWGRYFSQLTHYYLFAQQVRSAHGNDNLKEENLNDLWQANLLQSGHKKANLTIRYINDRKQYEKTRWLPALQKATIPIHFCWGEDDRVARVEMAHYLHKQICPQSHLTIMKNVGHFGQLGNPQQWLEGVLSFYS